MYCEMITTVCLVKSTISYRYKKKERKGKSLIIMYDVSFPGGSVVKNPPANVGDVSSIPGSGKSPGKGNGNPPQCSCPENSTDRGAWWATVHRSQKSWT